MTLAFDITVGGVITTISVIIHRVGLSLFAPGQPLYDIAAGATHFNGPEKAFLWFQIITIWAPLLVIGGVWMWVLIRAFKRQVTTAATPARR